MNCPYNLQFGKDFNKFESCDKCAEDNNEIYCDECGCEIRDKEFDLGLEFTELERIPEYKRR